MAFFTFYLDLSVLNARALQRALDTVQISENKRTNQSIVVRLILRHLRNRMAKSTPPLVVALAPPTAAIKQNQPADNNSEPQEDEAEQVEMEEEALDLQEKERFDHHHFFVKSLAQQG